MMDLNLNAHDDETAKDKVLYVYIAAVDMYILCIPILLQHSITLCVYIPHMQLRSEYLPSWRVVKQLALLNGPVPFTLTAAICKQ